jgi:hypothetical protein
MMKFGAFKFFKFKSLTKKFLYDFFIITLTAVGTLTPFLFYYFINAKPYKKIDVLISTYKINNNFNNVDIYNTSTGVKLKKMIAPYLDYSRRYDPLPPPAQTNSNDSLLAALKSRSNDSILLIDGLSHDIFDSLLADPIKDLKYGQYELSVTITNRSGTNFKNPTLEIASDFVYVMLDHANGSNTYYKADSAFRKINGHKINLGETLRPKETITLSILTRDNEQVQVKNGALYEYSDFPDIFFTVDEKIIIPTYTEEIAYSGNLDKTVTHWVINNLWVQIMIFGFSLLGIFIFIKNMIILITRISSSYLTKSKKQIDKGGSISQNTTKNMTDET